MLVDVLVLVVSMLVLVVLVVLVVPALVVLVVLVLLVPVELSLVVSFPSSPQPPSASPAINENAARAGAEGPIVAPQKGHDDASRRRCREHEEQIFIPETYQTPSPGTPPPRAASAPHGPPRAPRPRPRPRALAPPPGARRHALALARAATRAPQRRRPATLPAELPKMSLDAMRRRLPIVDALPPSRSRRTLPLAPGEMHRPRLAVWEFTLACDQRCLHCGPRSAHRRPDELTTDEALRLVRELADLGVGEVVLIGGEAYLRDDFILVIRAIREAGMACGVTTGGYNLTRARADAMVEAGVQSVSVSIDGLAPAHDHVRGRPQSWERALAALRHVKAAGARPSCNTQVNQRSRHDLLALADVLGEVGVRAWQLQITVAHGAAADHPDLILQPYMMLELEPVLDRLLGRCDELGIAVYPANNLGYFGPLEHRLRRRVGGFFRGCNAGKESIGIESDGRVKGCPSLPTAPYHGGTVRERPLERIWREDPAVGFTRRRTTEELWGFCATCYYAEVCRAGCAWTAHCTLGRRGNNPFCAHRAETLRDQGLRERLVPVEYAPGDPYDFGRMELVLEPWPSAP